MKLKNLLIATITTVFVLGFSTVVSATPNHTNDSNTDGKYSYFVAPNSSSTQIVKYNKKTGKSNIIYKDGEINSIAKIIVVGDKLIVEGNQYSTGTYGGSNYPEDTIRYIYSMNKDGSDIKKICAGSSITIRKGRIYYVKPTIINMDEGKGCYYGKVYSMKPDGSNKKSVFKKFNVSTTMFADDSNLYIFKADANKSWNKWKAYKINYKGKKLKKYNKSLYSNSKYTFYGQSDNDKMFNNFDEIVVYNKKGKLVKKIKTSSCDVYGDTLYYAQDNNGVLSFYKLNTKTLKKKKIFKYTSKEDFCYGSITVNKNGAYYKVSDNEIISDTEFYNTICIVVRKGKKIILSKYFVS